MLSIEIPSSPSKSGRPKSPDLALFTPKSGVPLPLPLPTWQSDSPSSPSKSPSSPNFKRGETSMFALSSPLMKPPARLSPLGRAPASPPVERSKKMVNSQTQKMEQLRDAAKSMDQKLQAARTRLLKERTARERAEEAKLKRFERASALQKGPGLGSIMPTSKSLSSLSFESPRAPKVNLAEATPLLQLPTPAKSLPRARLPPDSPHTVAVERGLLSRQQVERRQQLSGIDLDARRELSRQLAAAADEAVDGAERARCAAMRKRHRAEEAQAQARRAREEVRRRELSAMMMGIRRRPATAALPGEAGADEAAAGTVRARPV
jgi:hypothetical protein